MSKQAAARRRRFDRIKRDRAVRFRPTTSDRRPPTEQPKEKDT